MNTQLFADKDFTIRKNFFLIGIDVQEINTYILENNYNGGVEILLQKQIHDDAEFQKEVLKNGKDLN